MTNTQHLPLQSIAASGIMRSEKKDFETISVSNCFCHRVNFLVMHLWRMRIDAFRLLNNKTLFICKTFSKNLYSPIGWVVFLQFLQFTNQIRVQAENC